jgi:signal transduction histidine kinase
MKAHKGEWFCLQWDIVDFYNPLSFQQFQKAPRFLYAQDDSNQIEGDLINQYDRIRLISISRVSVFVTEDMGEKVPTHYRVGEFMPGDDPKYDKWLAEYHNMTYSVTEQIRHQEELQQKKVFLEHTARIIRHDMHSGINTYIPRGIKSLLRKLPQSVIEEHKLQGSIRLIQEGISYTQKVYRGVYAFTNLVKEGSVLEKQYCNLKEEISQFLEHTAYKDKVIIDELVMCEIQPILFCTAIDNLIKGGLQFNNSAEKWVKIYMETPTMLCVQDNGVGLSKEDFLLFCKPFVRKERKSEIKGLELNIAVAIMIDHGFDIYPEKLEIGTVFKINLDTSFKEYIIDNSHIQGVYPLIKGDKKK